MSLPARLLLASLLVMGCSYSPRPYLSQEWESSLQTASLLRCRLVDAPIQIVHFPSMENATPLDHPLIEEYWVFRVDNCPEERLNSLLLEVRVGADWTPLGETISELKRLEKSKLAIASLNQRGARVQDSLDSIIEAMRKDFHQNADRVATKKDSLKYKDDSSRIAGTKSSWSKFLVSAKNSYAAGSTFQAVRTSKGRQGRLRIKVRKDWREELGPTIQIRYGTGTSRLDWTTARIESRNHVLPPLLFTGIAAATIAILTVGRD